MTFLSVVALGHYPASDAPPTEENLGSDFLPLLNSTSWNLAMCTYSTPPVIKLNQAGMVLSTFRSRTPHSVFVKADAARG